MEPTHPTTLRHYGIGIAEISISESVAVPFDLFFLIFFNLSTFPSAEKRFPSTEERFPSTEKRFPSTEKRFPSAEKMSFSGVFFLLSSFLSFLSPTWQQGQRAGILFASGHTVENTPDLFRTPKLTSAGPG